MSKIDFVLLDFEVVQRLAIVQRIDDPSRLPAASGPGLGFIRWIFVSWLRFCPVIAKWLARCRPDEIFDRHTNILGDCKNLVPRLLQFLLLTIFDLFFDLSLQSLEVIKAVTGQVDDRHLRIFHC